VRNFGALLFSAASLTIAGSAAAEGNTPPAGWEVPPVATESSDKPKKKKKKIGPACCAFDSTCCSRQADIDAQARPKTVQRVVEVRIADIPEATVREAAEGEPPLENVPPVRLVNEDNQPYPWSRRPKEIRMLPPGPLGDIRWNTQWHLPSFDEKDLQSLGWGTLHYVDSKKPYAADAEISGNMGYTSIQQGQGDKLVFDMVSGTIAGSPAIRGRYHLHVEAAHVADKVVHAYRSTMRKGLGSLFSLMELPAKKTDQPTETITWVNFLLPQVIEGFESREAKHDGGFFPSRFSRSWPYSLYRLPFGPGLSNMATFRLDDDDKRRWIGVDKKRPPKVWMRHLLVTTSQTSAEKESRTFVMFFDEFTFD
jgi:hypothetical protein